MIELAIFMAFGVCWGSFLNVLAYRILHKKKFFTSRSQCPSCKKTIAWYDNIPLISWCVLRARCRVCDAKISWLYPAIELITGLAVVGAVKHVFTQQQIYNFCDIVGFRESFAWILVAAVMSNIIFVSGLIAATRTDLEAMVIPQFFTLWLVPVGVFSAYFGLLSINLFQSIFGALFGYGILWMIACVFKYATGKEGMGEGDMELMMMIGSFLGPLGVWVSLLIGSLSGMAIGLMYLWYVNKQRTTRIPFGPFLSLGAMLYLLFDRWLLYMLLGL